jgi:NAD(P)-dependent dehydrogenase (short-subunit alcohol dehydrogenase family)
MDVTESESVDAAVKQLAEHAEGRLGAVINFAGILDLGPMMEIPAERFARIFEINVVGTHRVNRAVLPLIRAGQGRIVDISSEAAMHRGGATGGPYSASKHAVDVYSDAIRQELMFIGVPVIVIRPGSFKTPMSQSVMERQLGQLAPDSPYRQVTQALAEVGRRAEQNSADPAILAAAVYRAVTARRPKARYAVKQDRLRIVGANLPPRVVDRLVRLMVRSRVRG